MARRINEKLHNPQSLGYSGSPFSKALTIATIPANAANTTVQDYCVLQIACKIAVAVIGFSSATNGVTAFNIVIGNAAEAGVLVADNTDVGITPPTVNTTPGLSLFQTGTAPNFTGPGDQAVAVATAYTAQAFPTSEPDAIFPQGTVLTLRLVSGGTVGGGCKVEMICIPVDLYPSYPFAFNWTNACVG